MMKEREQEELYLYAIVAPEVEGSLGNIGLFEQEVEVLRAGKLAAVVSPVPEGTMKIRPERRNLSAHQAVVSKLCGRAVNLLPVSFGTVVPSADDLRDLVYGNEPELLAQLEKVRGALEMEVRVELNVPNVFDYFLSVRPDLREARDRSFRQGAVPSRDEKIELGKFFASVLEEERERISALTTERLSGTVTEVKRDDCRAEREMARFSVLLPASRRSDFEAAVDALSRELDDRFTLFVSGPLPAYNFVDVHLRAAA